MIHLIFILMTTLAHSFPLELHSVYERVEIHEFYKDNELITKPVDAWQVIAAFSIVNEDLSLSKVCFKYKPSKEGEGIFKVERMSLVKKCIEEGVGLFKQNSLFGIQFQRGPEFKIIFSHNDFTTSSWIIKTKEKKKNLELLDTPDKFWGESVLFLNEKTERRELLKDGTLCLRVSDDCSVQGKSTCHQCENGFLEAPTGCLVGPRYCSSFECGTKGNPACRRGVKVLKQRVLDCRKDSSFAFCSEGSIPSCQGAEVWCH